jgi:hypothetical protein
MKEKFKYLLVNDGLYMAMVVVFVGLLSFLLGRQSVTLSHRESISVNPLTLCPTTMCPLPEPRTAMPVAAEILSAGLSVPNRNQVPETPFVASKSGTRYHHVTCSGAKQIKEENKIYFASARAAQAAGYSKAANCNVE